MMTRPPGVIRQKKSIKALFPEESLRKFVAAEVDPVDQMRYLKFLNFETLEERVAASPESVIQGLFRMRWDEKGNNWYVARPELLE